MEKLTVSIFRGYKLSDVEEFVSNEVQGVETFTEFSEEFQYATPSNLGEVLADMYNCSVSDYYEPSQFFGLVNGVYCLITYSLEVE